MRGEHYTLVCGYRLPSGDRCYRVIYLTRSKNHPRPIRYGRCGLHRVTRWNHHDAPMRTP